MKIKASNFPTNCQTYAEKDAFLKKYKELYGIEIRVEDVKPCPARRLAAKLFLNSGCKLREMKRSIYFFSRGEAC